MKKIILENGSFERIAYDSKNDVEVIVLQKATASLYIYMEKEVEANMHILVEEDATLHLLVWNESNECRLNNTIECERNAHVDLNLGELSDGKVHEVHKIHLQKEGSSLTLRSASTSETSKHFDIECIHEAPHTVSQMENYGVVYENGDFQMVDTGRILKGAYGSESHQTSRALILSEKQKCEITPELLIDENDVQASHATTMGQIDENQLYYLQTRGLTQTQALGLITIGYLMPIASSLNDEQLEKELTAKIEKKVGLA